jgi:hypothetical protein
MRQSSLTGFEKYTKKTRKERSPEEMDRINPWSELTQALKPYNPDPTGPGRRPRGLERMLRIYFMRHWFKCNKYALRLRAMLFGSLCSGSPDMKKPEAFASASSPVCAAR